MPEEVWNVRAPMKAIGVLTDDCDGEVWKSKSLGAYSVLLHFDDLLVVDSAVELFGLALGRCDARSDLFHLRPRFKVRNFHIRVLLSLPSEYFDPFVSGLRGLHAVGLHFVIKNQGRFPGIQGIVLQREVLGSEGRPDLGSMRLGGRHSEAEGDGQHERGAENAERPHWRHL